MSALRSLRSLRSLRALRTLRTNKARVALSAAGVGVGVGAAFFVARGLIKRRNRSDPAVHIERSVLISRAPFDVYLAWRNVERLPDILQHITDVRALSSTRSHWQAELGGVSIEWDAETVEDIPGQVIAWRSIGSAAVDMFGCVRFEPHNAGTILHVEIDYEPVLGKFAGRLLGPAIAEEVKEDLRRFKSELETGEIPTIQGQPVGRNRSITLLDLTGGKP